MIYIASPYSHKDQNIVEQRYEAVKEFTGVLLKERLCAFSPIVYAHELAKLYDLPTDAAYWNEFNMNILRRCEEMYLLQLDGWEESIGVNDELVACKILNIKVTYFDKNFSKISC